MRYLFALAALLAISPVALALVVEGQQQLRATPLPLDHEEPGRVRVGALRYLGGWQLRSGDRRFGGISALLADHGRFVGISDSGMVIRFRLGPAGVSADPIIPLPAGPGDGSRKSQRDSESATRDPASGTVWVGFENANELWRYAPDFSRGTAHALPPAMAGWPSNGGPEALVRLHDGRFLVFSESGTRPDGSTEALLFASDPTARGEQRPLSFGYRAPPGYRVTDAAELPDGRLLLLHRRFTLLDGISAKLAILDLHAIREGVALRGREVATLAAPLAVDNMEGLAVEVENGRTILWVVSDDNFSAVQRTVLLKFALDERE